MTEQSDAQNSLENTVNDSYLVYYDRKSNDARISAAEEQQRFETLVQTAEKLQKQYSTEKFGYRKFEYVKAISAVIKEKEIIDLLMKEGYAVKPQGKFTASKALYQSPSQNPP